MDAPSGDQAGYPIKARSVTRVGAAELSTGAIIRAASETKPGQRLKTRLKSGQIRSVVDD